MNPPFFFFWPCDLTRCSLFAVVVYGVEAVTDAVIVDGKQSLADLMSLDLRALERVLRRF